MELAWLSLASLVLIIAISCTTQQNPGVIALALAWFLGVYVAEWLGKPIGGDLREGKVTLPVILLLQRTGPDVAGLIQRIVENGDISPETWRTIKDQLASHGAVEAAFERAVKYGERAKQHLVAAFPASTERDGLLALTDYVLSRDR